MPDDAVALTAPEAREAQARAHLLARGWGLYLLAAVALVPVVVPSGPAQLAFVDVINVAAMAVFFGVALWYGIPLRLPFLLPILVISAGSLMAMANAVSLSAGLLAITQDAYLYIWFLVLVALLRDRNDFDRLFLVWLWVADLLALLVLARVATDGHFSVRQLVTGGGLRAAGTFYNANMFADYLTFSVFIALALVGRAGWRFLGPTLLLLAVAMLATKSNGGAISFLAGLVAWALASARARGVSWPRVAGVTGLGLGVVLVLFWLYAGLGVGGTLVARLEQQTFVGRVSKSTAVREQIWRKLEETYARSPLGLGPGNSSSQTLTIGERELSNVFQSKEAHSDYMGYAVERGPLGFLGLIFLTVQIFWLILAGRRRIVERLGSSRAGGILWAALLGALVATSVHSLVIEKLHFRHFWLFLAIVTALTLESRAAGRHLPALARDARGSGPEHAPAAARG